MGAMSAKIELLIYIWGECCSSAASCAWAERHRILGLTPAIQTASKYIAKAQKLPTF